MRDEFFLDTNVLVYTFDASAPMKRDRARELVARALSDRAGFISWQVVQEFLNVAISRFASPLSEPDAAEYLARVLCPLCRVYPTPDLYADALLLRTRTGFAFYDALVVAAARSGRARTLFSEDLQDGQVVDELRIVNPFRGP